MRKLFVSIVLAALFGVASAQDAPTSSAPVKQVEPLSEIVVFECGKFLGAVIVLPDGTLEPTQNEAAAKAVYGTLKDGHAAIVRACGPTQTT